MLIIYYCEFYVSCYASRVAFVAKNISLARKKEDESDEEEIKRKCVWKMLIHIT